MSIDFGAGCRCFKGRTGNKGALFRDDARQYPAMILNGNFPLPKCHARACRARPARILHVAPR
ncbi:hypothetical protein ABTE17_20525, partial [Acinetobacter baumannii]